MEMTDIEFVARLLAIPLVMVIDPFAPLLVLGIALNLGLVSDPVLNSAAFAGFGHPAFIAVTGALYVSHVLADKVPLFAHTFDAIGLIVKPLAGALVGFWMANKIDPQTTLHWVSIAVVVLGGIPASAGLQFARAKVRVATSAASVGVLHPAVSTIENFVAIPLAALAITQPMIALFVIAILVVPMLWLALRLIRGTIRHVRHAGGRMKSAVYGRAPSTPPRQSRLP